MALQPASRKTLLIRVQNRPECTRPSQWEDQSNRVTKKIKNCWCGTHQSRYSWGWGSSLGGRLRMTAPYTPAWACKKKRYQKSSCLYTAILLFGWEQAKHHLSLWPNRKEYTCAIPTLLQNKMLDYEHFVSQVGLLEVIFWSYLSSLYLSHNPEINLTRKTLRVGPWQVWS